MSTSGDIQEVLFSEEELAQRVRHLGAQISRDYASKVDEGIVLVTVLRGAAVFSADLARNITLPLEMDYIAVSSYGGDAQSSGAITMVKDTSSSIEGKHVIVVEDIQDTGLTLAHLGNLLAARRPASISFATLLCKKRQGQMFVDCHYVGFECPDGFVVGYGLDYAEKYRNLPYIGLLKPEIYS